MVQICIQNLGNRRIDSVDTSRKVIEIIHENGIDWMHSCGKKGRCTTCKMLILEGRENLSLETPQELQFRSLGRLAPSERLACQTQLLKKSITIKVLDPYKFPHLMYTK